MADPPRTHRHPSQPAACGRGSQEGESRSYRLRLREHLGPELRGQVAGCQQINVNAEQGFQIVLQTA